MPIYEFYCEQCDKLFEEIFNTTDKNTFTCTECGTILWRMVSSNHFHLKGLGWTDDARKQKQRWFDKIESTGKKKGEK